MTRLLGKDNTVTTFKKDKTYKISARKEGCETTTVPAPKSFDALTLLGVLLDYGVISVLLVDGATRALGSNSIKRVMSSTRAAARPRKIWLVPRAEVTRGAEGYSVKKPAEFACSRGRRGRAGP